MLVEAIPTIEMAAALSPNALTVCVGGVSLTLSGDSCQQLLLGSDLEKFRVAICESDIDVSVEWCERLSSLPNEQIFNSGAIWTLSHDDSDFVFDFTCPVLGVHPYKRLRVDRKFRKAQLALNRELLPDDVCPLEYPADELLITNYLASGLGIEVHGCGLVDAQAGGQLFLGHSGAGKSTTTRVWETFRNPKILSDDRIILRLHDGELWMYGTPWHGEAAFAAPGKAKLSRIFILQHGSRNEMRALPPAHAVGEIFARSFPPFHSATGLERTLEFIHRVLEVVPTYEFQFVPDRSAVKAVIEFND